MNKIIISLVAISLSFGMVADAQMKSGQGLGGNNVGANQVQQQAQIHEPGIGLQEGTEPQQIKANKQNANGEGYPRLGTTSEAVKAAAQKMQEERKAFQKKVEASKEEAIAKREQEKEALKTKLQGIKDEAKKKTVQKLDENMNKLSSNFVEKWTKNLTDFDTYLAKLVEKANGVATGKDLTAFNSAIESAKAAIVSARTSLEVQAKKTYALTISNEENLKADVSLAREGLNNDLKYVKGLVQAAHSATVNALTEFNKIK